MQLCNHEHISTSSVQGKALCLNCEQRVPHPWYSAAIPVVTMPGETGIERVEREAQDWPARMGVEV